MKAVIEAYALELDRTLDRAEDEYADEGFCSAETEDRIEVLRDLLQRASGRPPVRALRAERYAGRRIA